MKMKKEVNRVLWYYAVIGVIVTILGLGAISEAAPPIKVGFVSAWDFAGGKSVKRGTLMAVRDINAAGGVLGRKIEPIAYDNRCTSDEAKKVTERLLYVDKVDAIIGFWRSELGIASQPLVMEAKKILILTGAAAPILTKGRITKDYNTYKYTFSMLAHGGTFAESLFGLPVPMTKEKLGLDRVAVIAESTAFLEPTVKYVHKNFADIIVYSTKFPATATDFSMEFAKAKAAGANSLYVLSSGPAGTPSVKQWYDMQLPMLYIGYNVEAQNANFWKITEGKCDGVQTIHAGAGAGVPITEKSRPWYEAYKKMYGEYPISLMDSIAYDGVWAWAKAVGLAGSVDSDAVLKAFESDKYHYVGVSGILEGFDRIHNPYGGAWKKGETWALTPIQWQNGKREVIYPESIKTADMIIPERVKKLMGK